LVHLPITGPPKSNLPLVSTHSTLGAELVDGIEVGASTLGGLEGTLVGSGVSIKSPHVLHVTGQLIIYPIFRHSVKFFFFAALLHLPLFDTPLSKNVNEPILSSHSGVGILDGMMDGTEEGISFGASVGTSLGVVDGTKEGASVGD